MDDSQFLTFLVKLQSSFKCPLRLWTGLWSGGFLPIYSRK